MLSEHFHSGAPLRQGSSDLFDQTLSGFLADPAFAETDGGTILLLARSPTVPVAARLWTRLAEVADAGAYVSAVFIEIPDTLSAEKALADFDRIYGLGSGALRVAEDPKMFAGMSEQMCMGGHAIWIGGKLSEARGHQPGAGHLEILREGHEPGESVTIARVNFGLCWRNARAASPRVAAAA